MKECHYGTSAIFLQKAVTYKDNSIERMKKKIALYRKLSVFSFYDQTGDDQWKPAQNIGKNQKPWHFVKALYCENKRMFVRRVVVSIMQARKYVRH